MEKVEIRAFILPRNFPVVLIIFTGRGGASVPDTNGPGGYKSSEPNLPMDWVNESSKGMTLYFHRVFLQQEVLSLQSHVMTYDLQTTTAYWWCENFGEGHKYLRPRVRTRSRLLPCSGIPVVAGRQVATLAQSTSERAASSELLVALPPPQTLTHHQRWRPQTQGASSAVTEFPRRIFR